jgi:hypothetical protein
MASENDIFQVSGEVVKILKIGTDGFSSCHVGYNTTLLVLEV